MPPIQSRRLRPFEAFLLPFGVSRYAKSMCDSLQSNPVRIMYGGVAREIRITEADKRDVLKIMKEWVESSLTVLEAEFPAWHLLNCFDVFQLASGNSASKKRATESDTALAKLAKVFEVDEAALKSQYLSVLLTAQGTSTERWFGQPLRMG